MSRGFSMGTVKETLYEKGKTTEKHIKQLRQNGEQGTIGVLWG